MCTEALLHHQLSKLGCCLFCTFRCKAFLDNVCLAGHLQQIIKELLRPVQLMSEQFVEQRLYPSLHSVAIAVLTKPSINSMSDAAHVRYADVCSVQADMHI